MANKETSHLSHDEIDKHGLHDSKRPPGKGPRNVLGQQGGVNIKTVRNYPLLLGCVMVAVGLGTATYYRSVHPEKKGQAGTHSPIGQKAEEGKNAATQS